MNWWKRLAQNRLLDIGVEARLADGRNRRAWNRLLEVGAWVIALMCVWRIAAFLPSRSYQYDFAHYYVSSRLLLQGENPYTTSLAPLSAQYGFVYSPKIPTATNSPLVLWMIAPFAWFAPPVAFAGWVTMEVVSLGVILWLTRRLLGARLPARGWRFVCVAALTSSAVCWHFYFSHVELLLAAMVLAAYTCHREGKHWTACIVITTAGLAKLYPLALLPWFVLRGSNGWREAVIRAAACMSFAAATLLLTGLQLWHDFLNHGLSVVAGWVVNRTFNFSIPSFVDNLSFCVTSFRISAAAERWWMGLGLALGLGLIALAYAAVFRVGHDPEAEFCLLSVAMLAGCLTTWGYYFVFLIFPVTAAVARSVRKGRWRGLIWVGVAFLALNNFYNLGRWELPSGATAPALKLLANYIPLYGLLGLAAFFVRELWTARKPATAEVPELVSC